jgi:hypothetical protein
MPRRADLAYGLLHPESALADGTVDQILGPVYAQPV